MTLDNAMTIAPMSGEGDLSYLELRFAPNIPLVSRVRRFVTQFAEIFLDSRELSDKITVALHELLENTVKFSVGQASLVRVELRRVGETTQAQIMTRNRAKPEDVQTLERLITDMENSDDPLVFYIKLMDETSEDYTHSRLGLGRVLAEAGMKISYERDGDDVIIHAHSDWTEGTR